MNSIEVQHGGDNDSLTNIEKVVNLDLHICILHSDYGSLKIDNTEKEYHLDLFGYVLTDVMKSSKSLNLSLYLTTFMNMSKILFEYLKLNVLYLNLNFLE